MQRHDRSMASDPHSVNLARIDHYGRPSKWFVDYPSEYLDGLVSDLKEIDLILDLEFGLQMYLTWGTLLGAVREGDLIGHDFDIDVAYVSRARSERGVLRERRRILEHFARFGGVIGKPAPGRFMVTGRRAPGGAYDHGIEIWTSFVAGADYYGYPSLPGVLPARAIRPFGQARLRGVPFRVPRQTSVFLDLTYGKDWHVPRLPSDHDARVPRYTCFGFLYPS